MTYRARCTGRKGEGKKQSDIVAMMKRHTRVVVAKWRGYHDRWWIACSEDARMLRFLPTRRQRTARPRTGPKALRNAALADDIRNIREWLTDWNEDISWLEAREIATIQPLCECHRIPARVCETA